MISLTPLGNRLLLALTPETLAEGLFLFGWACMAAALLIAAVLAAHLWRHRRPDPVEDEIRRLQAEYAERRRRHQATHDIAARIGVLRHDQLRAELRTKGE